MTVIIKLAGISTKYFIDLKNECYYGIKWFDQLVRMSEIRCLRNCVRC